MTRETRFGVLIPQDAPFAILAERWRRAEDVGFDAAYVVDHCGDFRDQDGYWLDGWTVLTEMARHTQRMRIGTLISNQILHHPAQLAKQAVAVDLLSGGRLELGIGAGIAQFDHDAMGIAPWDLRERVERLSDYVAIVDGVLRGESRTFSFDGAHLRSHNTPMHPAPHQRPRPPITVAGQSPTVLAIAARHADCWNTHGPYQRPWDRTIEEVAEITGRQNERLDRLCEEIGRDPATLRRSFLLYAGMDAWASDDRFEKVVHAFRGAGIQEFVVFWPPDDRLRMLDELANTMAALRYQA